MKSSRKLDAGRVTDIGRCVSWQVRYWAVDEGSVVVGATGVSGELSFAAAVGILVAGEKAATDDRTGHGASVGEGCSVRVGVCIRVSSDEDIRNAVR